jgi:pimeloyl-ACP methyl ester carboxylesterase
LSRLFEFRFPVEAAVLFWSYGIHQSFPHVDDCNRKIVMMIPGFMAGDLTLAPLAKFCEWLRHKTFFTGIWSNSRCPREMVLHLERNLEEIHVSFGRVVIIGHRLGGMYALELAARRPDLIERVASRNRKTYLDPTLYGSWLFHVIMRVHQGPGGTSSR